MGLWLYRRVWRRLNYYKAEYLKELNKVNKVTTYKKKHVYKDYNVTDLNK